MLRSEALMMCQPAPASQRRPMNADFLGAGNRGPLVPRQCMLHGCIVTRHRRQQASLSKNTDRHSWGQRLCTEQPPCASVFLADCHHELLRWPLRGPEHAMPALLAPLRRKRISTSAGIESHLVDQSGREELWRLSCKGTSICL